MHSVTNGTNSVSKKENWIVEKPMFVNSLSSVLGDVDTFTNTREKIIKGNILLQCIKVNNVTCFVMKSNPIILS